MASKEQCGLFADEASRRFEEFVQWTVDNWPEKELPLLPSDFDNSRKELQAILGEKLNTDSNEQADNPPKDEHIQYIPMNPAPWP